MKLLILWILLKGNKYQGGDHFAHCTCSLVTDSQPILQPPTLYVCPNEIVTYTCYDRQIVAIDWIAEPYIKAMDPIRYVASTATHAGTWFSTNQPY